MAWDSVHLFECPTRVFYGRGASHAVGEHLHELGVAHALIVSDTSMLKRGVPSICRRSRPGCAMSMAETTSASRA